MIKRYLFSTGACMGLLFSASVSDAQMPGHGAHPPMPGQDFYFQCQYIDKGESKLIEVPLKIKSPTIPDKFDQVVELPTPLKPIHLKKYLPRAILEQNVVPDESGKAKPAIQLSIDGPKQSYQLWMVADDAEHNRLLSFIATWRYMAVENKADRDELFRQFENELTREPKLIVSRFDGSKRSELSLKTGEVQQVEDLKCSIRVLNFLHHYVKDEETKKPINRSDKQLNPAVLLEIERDGKKYEQWVFTKFPDFNMKGAEGAKIRVTLDCPIAKRTESPDYALVCIGRSSHEVWTRHKEKCTFQAIAIEKRLDVIGTNYSFHIKSFVPSGKLIEKYNPDKGKGAVPALQLEITDASGNKMPYWLEAGKKRVLSTEVGHLTLSFGPGKTASKNRH